MFYVYEWYIVETGEIFYVGKGCKNRYKSMYFFLIPRSEAGTVWCIVMAQAS